MVCKCGHQQHDWETGVCIYPGCWCMEFKELKQEETVIQKSQKYLEQLEQVEDRVRYILENIPESRNMKNKDFVFLYWHLVSKLNIVNNDVIKRLDDPESIRRCRQLLAQHHQEKYGANNQEHLTEKALKESGTYQFVLEKYQ